MNIRFWTHSILFQLLLFAQSALGHPQTGNYVKTLTMLDSAGCRHVTAVQYYTDDHQGNHRTVVSHDGMVEQVTHYYPFGAVYTGVGLNDALQHYKYNGKELDRMHGLNLYDYGYRQYDPLLARWTQMDRKCEEYYHVSPFVYCLNSPVSNIDPDGRSVWTKLGRMAYKVGRQVTKNGLSALNQIDTYTSAFSDITDNVNTLTDENASTAERVMAGISLASEVLPVSVGDAKSIVKAGTSLVHGNSKLSTKAQHAYDIINTKTGKVVKTGVSGGRIRKDGKSSRAESQVRKWNKEAGEEIFNSEITHYEAAGEGSRTRILEYERRRALKLRNELDPNRHKRP